MQLAALKTPRKHALARRTKIFRQKLSDTFILGQKLTENFCPTQDKFYLGRTKIFRKLLS